jgi:hypothetical protein
LLLLLLLLQVLMRRHTLRRISLVAIHHKMFPSRRRMSNSPFTFIRGLDVSLL